MQPPPIEVSAARDRAYLWLERQSPLVERSSKESLPRALDWLAAAWICERGLGAASDELAPLLSGMGARAIARRLDGQTTAQAFSELFACNTLQTVLARGILEHNKAACASLDAFVIGLVHSLAEDAGAAARQDELIEARILLGLLGVQPMPARPGLDGHGPGSALELLQADEGRILRAVSRIVAASGYGTAGIVLDPPTREMLCSIIGVWILDLARQYRLDQVALLSRTLAYLGPSRDEAVRGSANFLLAQQHPTGRFGFFGPEAARARARSPAFDEVAELHLPTTLACLWALAECRAGGFRLLASIAPR